MTGHRRSYKHTFRCSVLEELDHLGHVTGLQGHRVVTTTKNWPGMTEWEPLMVPTAAFTPAEESNNQTFSCFAQTAVNRCTVSSAPVCLHCSHPPLIPWNMTLALSVTGWWLAFLLYALPLADCLSFRSGWRGRNKIESWLLLSWHIFTQNRLIWSWDIVSEDVPA